MSTIEPITVVLVKACILVTLAFLMTRTRLLPDLLKARLSARDQVVTTIVFIVMGIAEVAVTPQTPMNLRIVAVAAAGLLGGRWVGLTVGIAITYLAMVAPHTKAMPLPIGLSMVLGGLAAGLIHDWRPKFAVRPLAGFVVGAGVSGLRDGLNFLMDPQSLTTFTGSVEAAVLQGSSVALILLVIEQARAQESQARATAMAEVRALQARMDPHFLFNSLNLLSALSEVDPRAVPRAAAHLGKFLRASIDRHDQTHVSLREELEVVDAYLEVEGLRLGDRLSVGRDIEPQARGAKVPPFLLQPLVENAVQHGIHPQPRGGKVSITARVEDRRLSLTVADDGCGMSDRDRENVYSTRDGHLHALALLRRRLVGLYGAKFSTDIESRLGEGSVVTVRIPYEEAETFADGPAPALLPGRGPGLMQGGS